MDEYLRKFQEKMQLREMDVNYALGLVEYYYADKLGVGWIDIFDYTYQKALEGVVRFRIKELFIEEVLDDKLIAIQEKERGGNHEWINTL